MEENVSKVNLPSVSRVVVLVLCMSVVSTVLFGAVATIYANEAGHGLHRGGGSDADARTPLATKKAEMDRHRLHQGGTDTATPTSPMEKTEVEPKVEIEPKTPLEYSPHTHDSSELTHHSDHHE